MRPTASVLAATTASMLLASTAALATFLETAPAVAGAATPKVATGSPTTSSPPATPAPATLMLQTGDVSGLAPSGSITAASATQWVRSIEGLKSGRASTKEIRTFTREGFEAGGYEMLTPVHKTTQEDGVSVGMVFASPRGARAELRREVPLQLKSALAQTPNGHAHRFKVASIPGSSAYTITEGGTTGSGTSIFFDTGHCFLVIGIAAAHRSPRIASDAATLLYHRVAASCAS